MAGDAAAPFLFLAGNLALDFINTVGNRLGRPREYLRTWSDALRWAHAAGLDLPAAPAGEGEAALLRLHRLREALYAGLAPLAAAPGRCPPAAVARLNRRLAALPTRRLAGKGGRLVWRWAGTPAQRLEASLVLSAADLLASPDALAVRRCQDERCGWLFLDHSQAKRRRWCSMADCGNRAKARRHQRRSAN